MTKEEEALLNQMGLKVEGEHAVFTDAKKEKAFLEHQRREEECIEK